MRVDADDFARPCSCGREHHIDVKEIIIESGAIGKLEKEMSDGDLKEYISPLLICDTNSYKVTEELMEDIYDRGQVLVLDAEDLEADERAVEIVENYMDIKEVLFFLIWQSPDNSSSFRAEPAGIFHPAGQQS